MKLDIQLFASSKTITKTIRDSYNNSYTVTATINESLPEDYVSTNVTLLSGTVKVSNTGEGGAYTSSKAMSATLSFLAENSEGSTLASATGSCKFDFRGSSTVTATPLTYNNLEIIHNNDGTRTIYIKLVLKITETSLKQTQTYTETLELTTIPRASVPTLSSSSINIGSQVTISTNRASDNFTHKITYDFGSLTNQTSGLGASTGITTGTTFTPPTALIYQTPNSTSGICTITCVTYNGSTQTDEFIIGTTTVALTLTVPSTVKPTVTIGTISEAGGVPSGWNVFVQNKSRLQIPITASGIYGSSIASIVTTVNGNTYYGANVLTTTITRSGTNTITTAVTDTRGRTTTATKNYTVVPYSNPTITTVEAQRCLQDGTIDNNGTYVLFTFVGSISAVDNNNFKIFQIGYKKTTDEDYTYVTISNTYSVNETNTVSSFTISPDYAYDIMFMAVDSFMSTSINRVLDTGFDLMNFNASGKAMAIGKVSEAGANEELLEIGLRTIFLEQVDADTVNFTASSYHDSTKQDILVSGSNIKTINNTSILGSGDISTTPVVNIMKARPSSNISITGTGNKKITLASTDFQNGSNLSISSGGIQIGAGITKVKVSGTVYYSAGTNAGDSLRCVIYKNDTVVAESFGRAGTSGTYETRSIIATPITVAQNDIIYLYYNNATAGRGTVSSSATSTYLIVEEIL